MRGSVIVAIDFLLSEEGKRQTAAESCVAVPLSYPTSSQPIASPTSNCTRHARRGAWGSFEQGRDGVTVSGRFPEPAEELQGTNVEGKSEQVESS